MPTKPTDLVKPWATAGNYPAAGTYPLELPWLAPNPVGGLPFPWNSQPRLLAGDITAFAANGHTPQLPDDASANNRWKNTVYQNAQWVELGTFAPDADAHVMETSGAGVSSALAYEATASFQGAGSTPAPFANGATISDGQTLVLTGGANLLGGATSTASVDKATARVFEMGTPGAPPAVRQLGAGNDNLIVYNDGTLKPLHISSQGYIYATGDQEVETALLAAQAVATTTVRVTALGLGNVRVIVEGWGQRSVVGAVSISVQNSDAGVVYSTIGTTQSIEWVDTSNANQWSFFRHERVFSAGTIINRLYRANILALGGANIKVRETNLRVVPERS